MLYVGDGIGMREGMGYSWVSSGEDNIARPFLVTVRC